jgi:hypothetical protein
MSVGDDAARSVDSVGDDAAGPAGDAAMSVGDEVMRRHGGVFFPCGEPPMAQVRFCAGQYAGAKYKCKFCTLLSDHTDVVTTHSVHHDLGCQRFRPVVPIGDEVMRRHGGVFFPCGEPPMAQGRFCAGQYADANIYANYKCKFCTLLSDHTDGVTTHSVHHDLGCPRFRPAAGSAGAAAAMSARDAAAGPDDLGPTAGSDGDGAMSVGDDAAGSAGDAAMSVGDVGQRLSSLAYVPEDAGDALAVGDIADLVPALTGVGLALFPHGVPALDLDANMSVSVAFVIRCLHEARRVVTRFVWLGVPNHGHYDEVIAQLRLTYSEGDMAAARAYCESILPGAVLEPVGIEAIISSTDASIISDYDTDDSGCCHDTPMSVAGDTGHDSAHDAGLHASGHAGSVQMVSGGVVPSCSTPVSGGSRGAEGDDECDDSGSDTVDVEAPHVDWHARKQARSTQEASKKQARSKHEASKKQARNTQDSSKNQARSKQEASKKQARSKQDASTKHARSKQLMILLAMVLRDLMIVALLLAMMAMTR